MPGISGNLDGPPPSPATNPAAAKEAGQMPISGLAGGTQMQMQPQGPDMSGVLKLFEQVEKGILALAEAVPDPQIQSKLEMARQALMSAGGAFASQAGSSNGSMPGAAPKGQVVSQAGNQFPAGGQNAGRPY